MVGQKRSHGDAVLETPSPRQNVLGSGVRKGFSDQMLWESARLLRSIGGCSDASGQPQPRRWDGGALHRRAPKACPIPVPLRWPSPDPAAAASFM